MGTDVCEGSVVVASLDHLDRLVEVGPLHHLREALEHLHLTPLQLEPELDCLCCKFVHPVSRVYAFPIQGPCAL